MQVVVTESKLDGRIMEFLSIVIVCFWEMFLALYHESFTDHLTQLVANQVTLK